MDTRPDADAPPRPLRLGDRAPDFMARSTRGPVRLGDHRGRWVLLVAHPGDFTPVCTSEFLALARAQPAFAGIGCEILALSIDSLYAHLAWLRDIQQRFGLEVRFPVIEDPSMVIARAYGMVDARSSDAATVRASYVIDPRGVIRAMSWYPMNVGRSVEETLRLVKALQTADRESASTPEGWREGQPLLEPAPLDLDAAAGDAAGGAWYLRERRP